MYGMDLIALISVYKAEAESIERKGGIKATSIYLDSKGEWEVLLEGIEAFESELKHKHDCLAHAELTYVEGTSMIEMTFRKHDILFKGYIAEHNAAYPVFKERLEEQAAAAQK